MFVYLIAIVVILVVYLLRNYSRPKDYPPGPFCLPIIGNWYCVPGQGIELKVAEWRKKYGNIIGLKMGSENLVVICGYKETVSALKNNNFQNRTHTTTVTHRTFYENLGLFFGDGEQYNEIRRFTVRYLNQATAANFESLAHEEIMKFFSSIKSGEIVQVDGEFSLFASNILFTYLIGDSIKSVQNEAKIFRDLVKRSFKTGRITGLEVFYPWFQMFISRKLQFEAVEYVQNFFKNRVREHRETFNPNNIRDYIDAYFVEQEQEKDGDQNRIYTDKELISCLLDMGQASNESTNNTISFLLMYVALNPRVQEELHKELDSVLGNRFPLLEDKSNLPYCVAVIEETMRINTIAATAVQHVASEDTKFHGYNIPEGTTIIFPFWDMFRNGDEFEDPESFRPERFISKETKHTKVINFGLGKRSCIGETVARKTMFLFVAYFFQKYSISLPKGYKPPDTEPLLGFTNSPKVFHLIVTERQLK